VDFVIGNYCELHKLQAYRDFRRGNLGITEYLNESGFIGLYLCGYHFDEVLINSTLGAFNKVWQKAI
jgi:hypothetical protein